MPPRTRDIFTLHRFGEMTYAAIGRQFEISTSAVEKHIMAASPGSGGALRLIDLSRCR